MKKRMFLLLPLFFALVSCGPIIGQLMRLADGVKDFRVVEGNISNLRQGEKILVVGPFDLADGAYYIARGDEAATFDREFNLAGYFKAELYMGDRYAKLQRMYAGIKAKSAEELKADYQLDSAPDLVMFGTVLSRETIVAPTRGIIMQVGYRLEFYNPSDKTSTVVEITVHEHFKDCIKLVVEELARRSAPVPVS